MRPRRCSRRSRNLKGAPGRLEKVAYAKSGAPIYVDYAHTPDALETVLNALRPHVAGKLHVVFGCGGDRDKGKRPLMGEAAAQFADRVIVTDDNPRSEDRGHHPQGSARRCVRARARSATAPKRSAQAIAALESGDILVIAGKGHETRTDRRHGNASVLRSRRSGQGGDRAGRQPRARMSALWTIHGSGSGHARHATRAFRGERSFHRHAHA